MMISSFLLPWYDYRVISCLSGLRSEVFLPWFYFGFIWVELLDYLIYFSSAALIFPCLLKVDDYARFGSQLAICL